MSKINTSAELESLFNQLMLVSSPPSERVFKAVEQCKKEMIPLLLNEIEQFSQNPNSILIQGNDYVRHVIALFLLAYFRETKAYLIIIKLISIPGDKVINLTGEVFTEALGRILASVYNGDLAPIKSVVENPHISPWLRAAALDSLMVLWKENELSRDEIVAYLQFLMLEKLERKASYVWDSIALIAFDLHPTELQVPLLDAIKHKLIEPMVLNEQSLALCLKDDVNDVIKDKDHAVDGYIKEPIKELTWWLYPNEELDKGIDYAAMAVPIVDKKIIPGERAAPMGWRADTVVHAAKKIGRNETCFCGSGKKYKKCCGGN